MAFGDSAQQGFVRGRNFYHPTRGFALTAPQRWRVENGSDALGVVNAASDAGLIVRVVPQKAGSTHEEIIKNALKPVDGRTEKRTIHGLAATHFSGNVRNDQGQTRPVTMTLVTGPDGTTYWLHYAAKDAAARQRAEPGLAEAESSFRAITAADRGAAKPWTVSTVAYPGGGFAELARSSPLPAARAEAQLRLMNGVYGGDGEPAAGQLVKTVVD
ncbi:MAG: hypothetical protein JO090_15535 [Rhizobacter sp.]|nr:hypothetical protein [Rhizobacter sp.]